MNPAEPKKLFYREAFNGGLVFAAPERAKFIEQIHQAIIQSKTWGEFRAAMPEEEYSVLHNRIVEDWEPEDIPAGDDAFSSDSVSGYSDGDYPAWLQQEMDEVLPKEILDAYGEYVGTMLNGNYWHIDPVVETELVEKLIKLGFEVEKREDLEFW